jgi:hypothetical protein
MKNLMFALGFICVLSCSKSSNTSPTNPSGGTALGYIKITLDGVAYSNNISLIGGTSGSNFTFSSCSGKPIFNQNTSMIENATFFFAPDLIHFKNAADYGSPSPASYPLFSSSSVDYFGSYCHNNLTLNLTLQDKTTSKYCILQSGGTHTIKTITLVPESSNSASNCYAVEGSFNANFKYPTGTIKPITGTYRTFIRIYK